jgi:hypothetical protein
MRLSLATVVTLLLAGCVHPEGPPPRPREEAVDCPYVGAVSHRPGCVDGGTDACEPVTCYCEERPFGGRRWVCPR